jgi:hypothetical protein
VPDPDPEPPDPQVPAEAGRTLDLDHEAHALRAKDVGPLIAREYG